MRSPLDTINDLQIAFEANQTPYKAFSRDNSITPIPIEEQKHSVDSDVPKTSATNSFDCPSVDPDADTVKLIREIVKPLKVKMSTGGEIMSMIERLGLNQIEVNIFLEEARKSFVSSTRLNTEYTYTRLGWRYSYIINQNDKKGPPIGQEKVYYEDNLVLIYLLLFEATEA